MGWPARRSCTARGSSRRKIQNRKRPARIQVEQDPRSRKARGLLQNPAAQNPRVKFRELAVVGEGALALPNFGPELRTSWRSPNSTPNQRTANNGLAGSELCGPIWVNRPTKMLAGKRRHKARALRSENTQSQTGREVNPRPYACDFLPVCNATLPKFQRRKSTSANPA